jgi:hypothetical protein
MADKWSLDVKELLRLPAVVGSMQKGKAPDFVKVNTPEGCPGGRIAFPFDIFHRLVTCISASDMDGVRQRDGRVLTTRTRQQSGLPGSFD